MESENVALESLELEEQAESAAADPEGEGKADESEAEDNSPAVTPPALEIENNTPSLEDDYDRRYAELTRRELRLEAHAILTQKGLPLELLDTLQYESAETMSVSLVTVEKAFRQAMQVAINDRLRQKTPGASADPSYRIDIKAAMGLK